SGTDRGVVVNLPDVLFEFGKARITNPAQRTIRDISEVIMSVPARGIYVEGHTDSVGTLTYNQKLSEDRSWSVADELVKDGVEKGRLSLKALVKMIQLQPTQLNQEDKEIAELKL
ncbi:MAG: OmpA family protein, partial [bacterium]|nr:OmpA family protein [bacterium]